MVQGRYSEAIDRFRQAILRSQAPNRELTHARNRLFLASAEQEKGWRDSASAELRVAHSLFRKTYFEPQFLMFLGKALARDGQLVPATEVFDSLEKRLRRDNPQDRVNEQVVAGELALARGRADSAVRLLRLAFVTDSTAFVRESLANAIAHSGDLTGAAHLYDSLMSGPDRWYGWEAEQYALSAPFQAGSLYERAGDVTRAKTAYEQIMTRWAHGDTDLVTVRGSRDGLARVQRKSGNLTPSSR
jgi:tetratricopeptide (TPR) repeat protein